MPDEGAAVPDERGPTPLVEIVPGTPDSLAAYAAVSGAYTVARVFEVEAPDGGLGGLTLRERAASAPYAKDYARLPDGDPAAWPERFAGAALGIVAARRAGAPPGAPWLGAAAVVHGGPDDLGGSLTRGRADVSVLWDLRVAADSRRSGVGVALFRAAERWAGRRGCRRIVVETQSTYVAACRLYARCGCALGAIDRFAYAGLPDETQLLWYREIGGATGG
jgi:GNAT superfamily N-acetyltransferase